MTFDWLTYVALASRLLQNREIDIEEAYLRASISRAYYGVFGALWDKKRMPSPAYRSKHHGLVMSLLNSRDLSKRKLGVDLDRLRRERNIVDYEKGQVITPQRALTAYSLALSIQSRINLL